MVSRGKHLLIRVGDYSIHTHLKMEGAWHIYPPDSKWRRPTHQARIVLATDDRVAVGFALGITEILGRDDEDPRSVTSAPTCWGRTGTPTRRSAICGRPPTSPSAWPCVDQRNLAGLGNVYRNEVCFLRGVHPYTPSSEVADLPALVTLAHRHDSRRQERLGIRHRPWVYGRAGKRCRRCGTVIEGHDLGQQQIFFCTYCQPPRGS